MSSLFQAEIDAERAEREAERRAEIAERDARCFAEAATFPDALAYLLEAPLPDWKLPCDCPADPGKGNAAKRLRCLETFRREIPRHAAHYRDIRARGVDAMSPYDARVAYSGSVGAAVLGSLTLKRNHIYSGRAWELAISKHMRKLGEPVPAWDLLAACEPGAAVPPADAAEIEDDDAASPVAFCDSCEGGFAHGESCNETDCGTFCDECLLEHESECPICGDPELDDDMCDELLPPDDVLPGMAADVAAQAAAAAAHSGSLLSDELRRSGPDVSPIAGAMESHSPLFRGSAADPQLSLF